MTKLGDLPEPIKEVTVPLSFHPSSFHELERCALAVLGPQVLPRGPGRLLAAPPEAYYGSLLHYVRAEVSAGRWGEAGDAVGASEALFGAGLRTLEAWLVGDSNTSTLVPLEAAVGRKRWRVRHRQLLEWAVEVRVERDRRTPRAFLPEQATDPRVRADGLDLGAEQTIAVSALRLIGRPDSSRRLEDGTIEIAEYKSGRIFDGDDSLIEAYVLQLQLYGLMVEALDPRASVRLVLEQGERFPVPWDATARAAVLERLETVSSRLPANTAVAAERLATPGPQCNTCRIRHRCSAYHRAAPGWWRASATLNWSPPLDVWGTVTTPVAQQLPFRPRRRHAAL